jgi:adhesin/invasin
MSSDTSLRPSRRIRSLIWAQIALQALFPLLTTLPVRAAETTPVTPSASAAPPDSASAPPWSQTLTTAASGMASGNLQSTATGMAAGAASSSVQEWLSQFGTARVNINVDDDGHWDQSSLDLLTPIYDNKKSVWFTQFGLRAPDNRVTGNFGTGVRTFYTENWMFGANVFFDDDFTGDNRRIGIGGEAWTNYLKLSANTYVGTTNWHSSRDFDDYNEKPADGYDIRAEGWLPAYPQLGAKVMYEQYYGDKVALFDKDHLQSNPSAVTTGISYTPVPLVSMAVNYRQGQGSMNDTQFQVNLRYDFGHDWRYQLNPENVDTLRTLAGSRYDLVERNNQIILQYKKKDVGDTLGDMTLSSVKDNSPADGSTVNTVTVHATTTRGNAMKNAAITWTVTGSGKLSSPSGVTDVNGNASVNITNTTAEQVTVTAASGAITRSVPSSFTQSVAALNLQLTRNNSQANGSDANSGQVSVTDASGKAMSGVAISWKVDNGAVITSSDATTSGNGQASVQFTSTTAGPVKLTASAGGKTDAVNAAFNSQSVSTVDVSMTTNGALANGTAQNIAQAVVKDTAGNVVPNASVTWTLSGTTAKAASATTVTTNSSGVATLSLTDTAAEGVTVTATAGGKSGNTTATFAAVPVSNVAVTMTTNSSVANGSTANVAQATVTDADGKPMANVSLTWNLGTGSASATTPLTVTTNASGIATLSLTDTVAEGVTVTATAGGKSGNTTATFTPVPVNAVAVTMTTNSSPANTGVENVAQALVTDASGKAMANVSLTWSLGSSTAHPTSPLTTTTSATGIATLRLTDTVAENVTVTATAGGKSGNTTAIFVAVPKAAAITLTTSGRGTAADPGIMVGHVVDSSGNPLAGMHVTWNNPPNRYLTCNSGDAVTNAQGEVTQTCHAINGSVIGQPISVTVVPSDTVDPSVPVTASITRDFYPT